LESTLCGMYQIVGMLIFSPPAELNRPVCLLKCEAVNLQSLVCVFWGPWPAITSAAVTEITSLKIIAFICWIAFNLSQSFRTFWAQKISFFLLKISFSLLLNPAAQGDLTRHPPCLSNWRKVQYFCIAIYIYIYIYVCIITLKNCLNGKQKHWFSFSLIARKRTAFWCNRYFRGAHWL
jgi:hypothetical protein